MTAEHVGFALGALLVWTAITVPIGVLVGKSIAWDARQEWRDKARQP